MDFETFSGLWPNLQNQEVTFYYGNKDPKFLTMTFLSVSQPMRQPGRPELKGRGCHRYIETMEGQILTVKNILAIKPADVPKADWIQAMRTRTKPPADQPQQTPEPTAAKARPAKEDKPGEGPYVFRSRFPDIN